MAVLNHRGNRAPLSVKTKKQVCNNIPKFVLKMCSLNVLTVLNFLLKIHLCIINLIIQKIDDMSFELRVKLLIDITRHVENGVQIKMILLT